MSVDLTPSPYNSRYDPEKKYVMQVAIPGRTVQAREWTEMQQTVLDFLRRQGEVFLKDGDVIEGVSIIIEGTTVSLTPGKIYYQGIIFDTDLTELTITGSGIESIGVKMDETMITEVEDSTLRDPAQGYDNYGQPGCYRIKRELLFTVDDDSAVELYKLDDGELYLVETKPEIDRITDILARRTMDSEGNFVVYGFESRVTERDDDNLNLYIDAGKAYVLGYEVGKSSTSHIILPKAKQTRQVLNEPETFVLGTDLYEINNTPVAVVQNLAAQVLFIDSPVTKTSGDDDFPEGYENLLDSVDTAVTQPGETYVKNVDYQIHNNSVHWISANRPGSGSTYYLTCRYMKNMVEGEDFQLYVDESGPARVDYIDFSPAGDNPVDGTAFILDYTYYLARIDTLTLNRYGDFNITSGKDDILRLVRPVRIHDMNVLELFTVLLYPDSDTVKITFTGVTSAPAREIQDLIERIDRMELNLALTNLDREAESGEDPSNLQGIFTDDFVGWSKADVSFDVGGVTFGCNMEPLVGVITPSSEPTERDVTINAGQTNVEHLGDSSVYYPPCTEEIIAEQKYACETMIVNPYNVYTRIGQLSLTPSADTWVDTEVRINNQSTTIDLRQINNIQQANATRVEQQTTNPLMQLLWTNVNQATSWVPTPVRGDFNILMGRQIFASPIWRPVAQLSAIPPTPPTEPTMQTVTSVTSRVISTKTLYDQALTYCRQISVRVTGTNFVPLADDLVCYVDSTTKADLTPDGMGTLPGGSVSGSVKANASGQFRARFTMPKLPSGAKKVEVKNDSNIGATTYYAKARKRIVQQTVLTTTTLSSRPVDPLAQSFSIDEDRFLSKVSLYFKAKSSTYPVIVQVRRMDGGFPGQEVLSSVTIESADVNVSSNGQTATDVTFSQPVWVRKDEWYAIVLLSDDPNYEVWIGTLGKNDVYLPAVPLRNPYEVGVLFSSSNAISWTTHQYSDLKFKLWALKATGTVGTVRFTQLDGITYDRILVPITPLIPDGTLATISFSSNGGTTWYVIESMEIVDIGSNVSNGTLDLKIELTPSSDNKTFPLLKIEDAIIITETSNTGNDIDPYISKNVEVPDTYQDIVVYVDTLATQGTNINLAYATDMTGTTWNDFGTEDESKTMSYGIVRRKYSATVSGDPAENYRIKISFNRSQPHYRVLCSKMVSILK